MFLSQSELQPVEILTAFYDNPDELRAFFDVMNPAQRHNVILSQTPKAFPFIHSVLKNPASLKVVIEQIPDEKRISALQIYGYKSADDKGANKGCDYRQAIERACADYPESLKVILDTLPSEILQDKYFKVGRYEAPRILQCSASNADSFKLALERIPEETRQTIFFNKEYGAYIFRLSTDSPSDAVKNLVVGYMDKKMLLDALAFPPKIDRKYFVNFRSAGIKIVLDKLFNECNITKEEFYDACVKDKPLLYFVINQDEERDEIIYDDSLERLHLILSRIPEEKLLEMINIWCEPFSNHLLAYTLKFPAAFKVICEYMLCKKISMYTIVTQKNDAGRSLFTNVPCLSDEAIEYIFNNLTSNEVEQLFTFKVNRQGDSILYSMSHFRMYSTKITLRSPYSYMPSVVALVLSFLPEEKRLSALNQTNNAGETVLCKTFNQPDALDAMLRSLPAKSLESAIERDDFELLHTMFGTYFSEDIVSSFNIIMNHLPLEQRIKALSQTGKGKVSLLEKCLAHGLFHTLLTLMGGSNPTLFLEYFDIKALLRDAITNNKTLVFDFISKTGGTLDQLSKHFNHLIQSLIEENTPDDKIHKAVELIANQIKFSMSWKNEEKLDSLIALYATIQTAMKPQKTGDLFFSPKANDYANALNVLDQVVKKILQSPYVKAEYREKARIALHIGNDGDQMETGRHLSVGRSL